MANDDSRYVGSFFTSYTNTRMKLHRHCVPLNDDPVKISKVYGYPLEQVQEIFRDLDHDLDSFTKQLAAKFASQLEEKLRGKTAVLAFIGDQLTSEYLSYYQMLKKLLQDYPGIKFVLAGNTGDTANQSVQYLYSLAVSQSPNVTSLLIGTNDIYESNDPFHKTVSSCQEYRANLNHLVKVLRHHGSKILLNTLPPVNEEVANKAYAHMNWNCRNDVINDFNNAIRSVATENHSKLNDVAAEFKKFEGPINLPDNGVMLTGQAQCFLAETILAQLLQLV